MKSKNDFPPIVNEQIYNAYTLSTIDSGNGHFTTYIYRDGGPVGGCFAGPLENSDSISKAKRKVDGYVGSDKNLAK